MKRSVVVTFALAGLASLATQKAQAGSAVAMEIYHGGLATAYGGPVEREKQRALQRVVNYLGHMSGF